MNEKFRSNFESIKKTVLSNLSTIGSLFEQAKNLREIIESLNETEVEKKAQMEKIIGQQYKSMDELVDQTDQLFKIYNEFLDDISK